MSHGPRSPNTITKANYTSNEIFKPMQIIKMFVDTEKDKIVWKNGNKILF